MNLFNIEKIPNSEELTTILGESKNVRIERIISSGQTSPEGFWYDQNENEFVALLQGEAVISYEDVSINLKSGDTVLIPAHKKHRVDFTSVEPPCVQCRQLKQIAEAIYEALLKLRFFFYRKKKPKNS